MAGWTFITNHGAVLVVISQNNRITAREIAAQLGITERSVQRIIMDLEDGGYISKQREGRVNRYEINRGKPLRRKEAREVSVGDLIEVLSPAPKKTKKA